MLYLHPGPDGGAHALVRLNGPLGLQRTARTDLLRTPTGSNYVAGRAIIGTRTEAYVTWTIEGGNPGSVVTLWVNVLSTDLRDRLVLRLGGRRWLAGQCKPMAISPRWRWRTRPPDHADGRVPPVRRDPIRGEWPTHPGTPEPQPTIWSYLGKPLRLR